MAAPTDTEHRPKVIHDGSPDVSLPRQRPRWRSATTTQTLSMHGLPSSPRQPQRLLWLMRVTKAGRSNTLGQEGGEVTAEPLFRVRIAAVGRGCATRPRGFAHPDRKPTKSKSLRAGLRHQSAMVDPGPPTTGGSTTTLGLGASHARARRAQEPLTAMRRNR
ncbi:MAG: hypothetical protein ACI9MR_001936 [Myxococcota bacterium]|jgi:hypothetical protein